MTQATSDRELRHAVAQLSRCTFEDIQAIWSELATHHQERLRPLLAQASGLVPQSKSEPDRDAIAKVPADAADVPAIGRYIRTLPDSVAALVLVSLDQSLCAQVLAEQPKERQTLLRAAMLTIQMKPAARVALCAAALAAYRLECVNTAISPPATPGPRSRIPVWMRPRLRT